MKLYHLIRSYQWLQVLPIFLELYADEKPNIVSHERVFQSLKILLPKESTVTLEIDRLWEDGEETNYAEVYGIDYTLPETVLTRGVAIEFVVWEEWLFMEIGKDAFEEWSDTEIISHALYEMTLEGFTQEDIRASFASIVAKATRLKEEYQRLKN